MFVSALLKNKMTYFKLTPYIDNFRQELHEVALTLNLPLSDQQIQTLLRYLDSLLMWNKAYNLTAIKTPKEALVKHIFDCLAIVPSLPLADKAGVRLLDIGTGAGLPAVIIAILRPDWHVTALDSNSKKVRFIRQIKSELHLDNLAPVACRIEEHHAQFAKTYDVITSRAFASLGDFVSLAAPCLKDDGVLYAMKGKPPTDEELARLSAWQIHTQTVKVPQLDESRCVVFLTQ